MSGTQTFTDHQPTHRSQTSKPNILSRAALATLYLDPCPLSVQHLSPASVQLYTSILSHHTSPHDHVGTTTAEVNKSYVSRTTKLIASLPEHLTNPTPLHVLPQRSATKTFRLLGADSSLPPAASLCRLHRKLNAQIIASALDMIEGEVEDYLPELEECGLIHECLHHESPGRSNIHIQTQQATEAHGLHQSAAALLAPRLAADEYIHFYAHPPPSEWTSSTPVYKPHCGACILTRVGSSPDILTALRASLLARATDAVRAGRERWVPLEWVDSWIYALNDEVAGVKVLLTSGRIAAWARGEQWVYSQGHEGGDQVRDASPVARSNTRDDHPLVSAVASSMALPFRRAHADNGDEDSIRLSSVTSTITISDGLSSTASTSPTSIYSHRLTPPPRPRAPSPRFTSPLTALPCLPRIVEQPVRRVPLPSGVRSSSVYTTRVSVPPATANLPITVPPRPPTPPRNPHRPRPPTSPTPPSYSPTISQQHHHQQPIKRKPTAPMAQFITVRRAENASPATPGPPTPFLPAHRAKYDSLFPPLMPSPLRPRVMRKEIASRGNGCELDQLLPPPRTHLNPIETQSRIDAESLLLTAVRSEHEQRHHIQHRQNEQQHIMSNRKTQPNSLPDHSTRSTQHRNFTVYSRPTPLQTPLATSKPTSASLSITTPVSAPAPASPSAPTRPNAHLHISMSTYEDLPPVVRYERKPILTSTRRI